MENPTSFDLNEAIRRWRAEFGSPSSLSAVEVEELEAHLRDHVAGLQAGGMTPEAAFAAAVKQLGERQRVATEFAKINPQRIWLERAIWMVIGVVLLEASRRLAQETSSVIYNYGWGMHWHPALLVLSFNLCEMGIIAMTGALLWFIFTRKPDWGQALGRFCERNPVAAGGAVVLMVWGGEKLYQWWHYYLYHWLPWLDAWLYPSESQGAAAANVMSDMLKRLHPFLQGIETVFWAVILCALATRVMRVRDWTTFPVGVRRPQAAAKRLWLERLLWMCVGCVLLQFVIWRLEVLVFWIFRGRIEPLLGTWPAIHHVAGFANVTLRLAMWTVPFWAWWFFSRRWPGFGGWVRRAFQCHPVRMFVGVVLLLYGSGLLPSLLPWSRAHHSPIVSEWLNRALPLVSCMATAVLLVGLLRWRMRLRAAE